MSEKGQEKILRMVEERQLDLATIKTHMEWG